MGNVLFWYRNLRCSIVYISHGWYKSWSALFCWFKSALYGYSSYTSSSKRTRFWQIVSLLNYWSSILGIWVLEKSVLSFSLYFSFDWMCTDSCTASSICEATGSSTIHSRLFRWFMKAWNLSLNAFHLLRKNMTLNTTRKVCIISSKCSQVAL